MTATTHGLWGATALPPPETAPLYGDVTADVAVIGAGFAGCSAALHLAQGGASVVVIEAAEIGFGASGRNVGLVNAGLWLTPDAVGAAVGQGRGEALLEQLGAAPGLVFELIDRHAIACEAVRNGTLHCAVGRAGERELAARARQWQARGVDVTVLEGDDAAQAIGSAAYRAVLLDPRAGTVQPLSYVRGLAHTAIRNGARIHTGSPAIDCVPQGRSWRIVTPSGAVIADRVIVATDAYSQGPWRGIAREQVALPYFNLATRPLPADALAQILPGRQGAWDTRSILSSFRLDAAGRLIFGSVGALRAGAGPIHESWARRALAKLFPQLSGIGFDHAWYGTIGMTSDAIPRLHELASGIVAICGYNGRGIAPGTSLGRDLAAWALEETSLGSIALPLTALTRAPLRAARSLFYEAGAVLAHAAADRI